jgi:hypothetical protein
MARSDVRHPLARTWPRRERAARRTGAGNITRAWRRARSQISRGPGQGRSGACLPTRARPKKPNSVELRLLRDIGDIMCYHLPRR